MICLKCARNRNKPLCMTCQSEVGLTSRGKLERAIERIRVSITPVEEIPAEVPTGGVGLGYGRGGAAA